MTRWALAAGVTTTIIAIGAAPASAQRHSSGATAMATGSADTSDHTPHFKTRYGPLPPLRCIPFPSPYADDIYLYDIDLRSLPPSAETITLRVLEPDTGFIVTPALVNGPLQEDSIKLVVSSRSVPRAAGRHRISIEAADAAGHRDTIRYDIAVTDPVLYSMMIDASHGDASQRVELGIASRATSGYASATLGTLDTQFCEYELPPLPLPPVFDMRWLIPGRNGILRSIHPAMPETDFGGDFPWRANMMAGSVPVDSTHPVILSWDPGDAARATKALYLEDPDWNDAASTGLLRINMESGKYQARPGVINVRVFSNRIMVLIINPVVTGFKVVQEGTEGLDEHGTERLATFRCAPNPFTESTTVTFTLTAPDRPRIEIYDAGARYVRSLFNGPAEPGEHELQWDGTDDQGRPCPAGSYHCRIWLRSGGETVGLRIVR